MSGNPLILSILSFLFIGKNGAGKTTTMKLMLGMALRDGGDIRILGKSGDDVSLKEDLGVLFSFSFSGFTRR